MQRPARTLPLLALLSLAGCRLVSAVIAIPIVLVAAVTSILVGAEGLTNQDELRAAGIRIDRHDVEFRVEPDLRYRGTVETVRTVTAPAGLADAQVAAYTFDPRCQTLELECAEVIAADGTRVPVGPEQVFTRPSVAAQGAPAFLATQTRTVVFPQLRVGASTRVKWRFAQQVPSSLGFHFAWRPALTLPVTRASVRITCADGVDLHCDASPPFELATTKVAGGTCHTAVLQGYEGQAAEPAMVDPRDVCPQFVASSIDRWETVGARFHDAVHDRATPTPTITALARSIVGPRTGLDAAQAIHRWVATNIQYVAVYLQQSSGWVPHTADEVRLAGYGDCKDQYVLLAALLAAVGIDAEPVLVGYDRSHEPYRIPTPLQFDHCLAWLPAFDLFANPIDPYRDLGDLDLMLADKFVVFATATGRVGRTPAGSPERDRVRIEQQIDIAADGRVQGRARLSFAGRPQGRFRKAFALAGSSGQAADGLLATSILGGTGQLRTTPLLDLATPLQAEGEWQAGLPLVMGAQLRFLAPAGFDLLSLAHLTQFLGTGPRRTPMLVPATTTTSRRQIRLPPGYAFAALPPGREVRNEAGSFTSRYTLSDDGQLVLDRTLCIARDHFPPALHAALRELLLATCLDLETSLVAERRP